MFDAVHAASLRLFCALDVRLSPIVVSTAPAASSPPFCVPPTARRQGSGLLRRLLRTFAALPDRPAACRSLLHAWTIDFCRANGLASSSAWRRPRRCGAILALGPSDGDVRAAPNARFDASEFFERAAGPRRRIVAASSRATDPYTLCRHHLTTRTRAALGCPADAVRPKLNARLRRKCEAVWLDQIFTKFAQHHCGRSASEFWGCPRPWRPYAHCATPNKREPSK